MAARLCLYVSSALALLACSPAPECLTSRDCPATFTCVNSVCEGPPCSVIDPCEVGVCTPEGRCRQPDAGVRRDGGTRRDGGDREDARVIVTPDASTDSGPPPTPDSGPPCECTPTAVETITCGTCGQQSRFCGGDCRWTPFGVCTDTDARCFDPAPYCVNDYCWGFRIVHESGVAGTLCIDMANDYIPGGDPAALGSFDIQVFGRPGASWTKQNRQVSCGGTYYNAETGVLNAGGGDDDAVFVYGMSDCDLILGQFESRVHIYDTVGGEFDLPAIATSTFYNSLCTADRNTCASAASYCVPLP